MITQKDTRKIPSFRRLNLAGNTCTHELEHLWTNREVWENLSVAIGKGQFKHKIIHPRRYVWCDVCRVKWWLE